jgi:integrase
MAGEGSVYKRSSDGRWVATLSRGPRGANQVRTVYRRTRAEARVALDELRASFGPITSRESLSGYLERWVNEARDIRPTTRSGYRAAIVTHIAPAIGMVRLSDLSPLHVERMLVGLHGSEKTKRNAHIVLRRALGQAVRAGLVTRNVASREFVDAPKVVLGEPDVLSPAEVKAMLASLVGHPLEAAVVVALGTGLRQGEQLGLAWEDIDGESLRVRKELARVDGRYERVEPKTARSKRSVPMAPAVQDAFADHRARLVAAGFVPTATGPVFVNASGGPLNGSWLTHRWYDVLAAAGIRRRPWKILRATFGSRLFAAGVPDRRIADLMGHSRTHTTHRHYIGTADAAELEALRRVVG